METRGRGRGIKEAEGKIEKCWVEGRVEKVKGTI
jgi:hypothetical protein